MPQSLLAEDDLPAEETTRAIKIITVGGGKGGIGKTLVSSSLAIALAEAGTRVVLVDADLGGANVHTVMGIPTPEKTLHDFISRKVKALADVIIPAPIHGLQLICGAAGSIGMANMEYADKLKLIRHFRRLLAEFVIVDIGAGMSLNEVDLFNAGDIQIVVANPEPTSIQECYNFIKVAVFRRLRREFADAKEILEVLDRSKDPSHVHDRRLLTEIGAQIKAVNLRAGVRFFRIINSFSPKLILNRVYDYRETLEGLALQIATQDLLRLRLDFWGYMSYDPYIAKAVRAMRPGEILAGDPENRERFLNMVQQYLLGQNVHYRSVGTRTILPIVDLQPSETNHGRICSHECPLWQNCELQEGGLPCRMPDHMYRERLGGNLLTAGK
ncbi:MAG: P-loop NTPase [candidate division KSB1 bacterium]